jgi:ribosomal protein S18 acetylase RimI-like enzyme
MFDWLKKIFREDGTLFFPSRPTRLPSCRIRTISDSDFSLCEEIYRLNEPGRFPDGYFNVFSDWLRNKKAYFLVVEVEGTIRGFGGVGIYQHDIAEVCTLSFGMVHPTFHKQGFGTALLLARLATLPKPKKYWTVLLSTTGGSETFYSRFGFFFLQRERGAESEIEFDYYNSRLLEKQWSECRAILNRAGIILEHSDAEIPVTTLSST